MEWLTKIGLAILGSMYVLLALLLALLFLPALAAITVGLLSVGVFSPTFYKHVIGWCFRRSFDLVIFFLRKGSDAFRESKNLML
jgi:hypothetical protein